MANVMDEENGGKSAEAALGEAVRRTRELRTSEEPRWERVRDRLASEGVSPDDVVIAEFFNDDWNLDFCLLVVRDGRAFGVDLDYHRDKAGNPIEKPEEAFISSWKSYPEGQHLPVYAKEIELGLQLLREERDDDV
jgi:hypothetical protein